MIEVVRYSKEEWKPYSEKAHLAVFDKHKSSDLERIDFALLCVKGEEIISYATCREFDGETLYIAYGGVFHDARKTSMSIQAYHQGIDWCKARYKRITTLIENENVPMLKMAMKEGLRIRGTRFYSGILLVEMGWERE